MQSMTPADRIQIDATLLSLPEEITPAIAFIQTEFHVSEDSLAKDSDVFVNVALLRIFSDSFSHSQSLRAMLLLKNADNDMDLADDGMDSRSSMDSSVSGLVDQTDGSV